MTRVRLVTLGGDPEREAEMAAALGARGDVELVLRCVDRVELLAVIRGGRLGAIVSVGAPAWLDREAVAEAAAGAIRLVGLPADDFEAERLTALGAVLAPVSASPDEVVALCTLGPREHPAAAPEATGTPHHPGRLIAVWGPEGSPGRTTLAVELAAQLARENPDTLIIDGDSYGGDILQLLGILDEVPTVVWAARMAAKDELGGGRLKAELSAPAGKQGPVVLPGITRSELWAEVSDFGWRELLDAARATFAFTVCDTGFCLEPDFSPVPDAGDGRNRMARCALRQADRVIAVCRADPVGVKGFLWAYEEMTTIVDPEAVSICVNRAQGGAADKEVAAIVRRHTHKSPIAYVPDAPGDLSAALAAGRSVSETSPRSDVCSAVRALAVAVGGGVTPRGFLTALVRETLSVVERSVGLVEEEVRELVRRRGLDPTKDGSGTVEVLVDEVLTEYEHRTHSSNLPRIEQRDVVRKEVLDRVAGLGPLQPLLDDPLVEEIWINGPGRVFCATGGRHVLTNVVLGERELRDLVERMLRASGRRLDLSSPFVDATLVDGSRLHVVIPDITPKHWAVNIRKFVLRAHRLDELVRLGSLAESAAHFLEAAVRAGLNIVVSGGTQTGKTTMLNCLAAAIPGGDRVITCEEVFELRVPLADVVSMQTCQANLEGEGAIDLRRLIVEALRMRPDRIIVGEVRQQEALDLLVALNSGLPGMTSIHANSALEAVTKLTTLPLLAGENVSHAFVVPTVAASIDLIVHLTRARGARRTEQILAVTGRVEGHRIETMSMWDRTGGSLRWTGHRPPSAERFAAGGIDLDAILR